MNRVWRAVEAAYRRPPLLWTVQLFEWLATPLRRYVDEPLQRWLDQRRAAQLRELAILIRGAGLADAAARLDAAANARER